MKAEVVLCRVVVVGDSDNDLCLEFVERGKEWGVVVNNKMRHELPENLREKKEDIQKEDGVIPY